MSARMCCAAALVALGLVIPGDQPPPPEPPPDPPAPVSDEIVLPEPAILLDTMKPATDALPRQIV